jgi:crotonobetainyl-CoA:carnitine CoA-transferase CaiB-like acyl-CoA transferase
VGAFWASTSIAATLMPEGRHMLYPGGFGDSQTGEDLFASTCAALMHRMEGGNGQLVDSSLQRFGMWYAL